MRFQIPSQASLNGIVQTHRSLARVASSPASSRTARDKELPKICIQKKLGAGPACRDSGVFEKTSASLLARGFAKKPLHSRSEFTP
jgi:hypothetical protein